MIVKTEKMKIAKGIELFISILFIILFYSLSRRGGNLRNYVTLIIVLLFLFRILYLKKNNFTMFKKEHIFGMLYIFLLSLIFLVSKNKSINFQYFYDMTFNSVIFFLILLNMNLNKMKEKYLYLCLLLVSIGPIYRGVVDIIRHYNELNYYRIEGGTYTTIYALELGIYFFVCLIIFLKNNIWIKFVSGIYASLILLLIIYTQSRTTLIGGFFTFLITIILWNWKKGFRIVLIFLIFLNILFKFCPNIKPIARVSTLIGIEKVERTPRVPIFLEGIKIGRKNMVKGVGFYKYRTEEMKVENLNQKNTPHFHNIFIETFATQGFFLLISYAVFLVVIFVDLLKKYLFENDVQRKYGYLLGVSVFVFSMFYGMSESIFYFGKLYQLIFIILGISMMPWKER